MSPSINEGLAVCNQLWLLKVLGQFLGHCDTCFMRTREELNGIQYVSPVDCMYCAYGSCFSLNNFFWFSTQVCDSDTMLDPASSVEMVKVLEEDPMVGGVGGDVQVSMFLMCKTN